MSADWMPARLATLSTYDHQSRPLSLELPRDPDFDAVDPAPPVVGRIRYNERGLMRGIDADIDAVEHRIIKFAFYQADGLPQSMWYGDGYLSGGTIPVGWLREVWQYDQRRRVDRHLVDRQLTLDPPDASRPLGAVTAITDERLGWDGSNNLVSTREAVWGNQFPTGHRPAQRDIEHDALYRVAHVAHSYRQDDSTYSTVDPATDWRAERTRPNADATSHGAVDPGRRRPAPMLPALAPNRVVDHVYRYDWLGNQTAWTDDAQNFYERSLGQEGQVGNGFDDPSSGTSAPRPAALYFSSNIRDLMGGSPGMSGSPAVDRGGWLDMDYGDGGNLVSMTVRAQCHDPDATTECHDDSDLGYGARESFLRVQCVCDSEQHYQYRWDETNRLLEARRYDRAGSGNWDLAVRQRYQYDGANVRTIKQTLDETPAMGDPGETVALYIYPGDFERRGLRTNYGVTPRYDASAVLGTETQYMVGPGRITWKQGTPAAGIDREHRITASFGNLIQSTGAVVELQTGRILEMSTYYPNGARENHRTSGLASFSLEPVGFTGKEADEEVGLVYFGERYLVPRVGRWASPDPLQVHAGGGGEFGNSYHYVGGNLLQGRDPTGLAYFLAGGTAEVVDDPGGASVDIDNAEARQAGWADFQNGLSDDEVALFQMDTLADGRGRVSASAAGRLRLDACNDDPAGCGLRAGTLESLRVAASDTQHVHIMPVPVFNPTGEAGVEANLNGQAGAPRVRYSVNGAGTTVIEWLGSQGSQTNYGRTEPANPRAAAQPAGGSEEIVIYGTRFNGRPMAPERRVNYTRARAADAGRHARVRTGEVTVQGPWRASARRSARSAQAS